MKEKIIYARIMGELYDIMMELELKSPKEIHDELENITKRVEKILRLLKEEHKIQPKI